MDSSKGGATSRGGTSSKGGTTSRGGTSSTGGTSSGGTCSVTPVNPKATQQVKNVLCYLYGIYGKNVLSGQQETSWSNPANDISWYATNGMKYPAILGGDFLYPSGTTTRAIAYWNAGGLTMIRYHMGAPPLSDTYENSKGSANIANVLTSGTAENTSFKSKLDYVATELKKLKDANVPVIWAPFHEFQPNGWFWWSKGTPAQFNELWKYMFDYLTNTQGINNVLWLAPSSGTPTNGWFPNKSYYDLRRTRHVRQGCSFREHVRDHALDRRRDRAHSPP
ncbi:MAG: glycosyl hydrolase [Polyangiaceae bacterium]